MRCIGQAEVPTSANLEVINAYNKMHSRCNIVVEWGIRGLKRKWRCLMKRYDCTRDKYMQLVYVVALLTNFIQRRRKVLGFEVVGEPHNGPDHHKWDGDY